MTGFGGPPAHIALLRRLVVDRYGWMDDREFEDANAACGLLPGPASTQLAILCAYRIAGTPGAIIGGLGFIAPAVLLVLASALAAGLAGDYALSRYVDLNVPSWPARAFGFGLPFVFWAVYLALAYVTVGGFWWSPHVAYGAPVIAGICGLLFTLASEPWCGRRDSNPQPTSS